MHVEFYSFYASSFQVIVYLPLKGAPLKDHNEIVKTKKLSEGALLSGPTHRALGSLMLVDMSLTYIVDAKTIN